MDGYKLFIKPSAVKELASIPQGDRRRLVRRIESLAANPRPLSNEKLSGEDKYRVRRGNYRVIYLVNDESGEVIAFKVGHRREVYR